MVKINNNNNNKSSVSKNNNITKTQQKRYMDTKNISIFPQLNVVLFKILQDVQFEGKVSANSLMMED